MISDIIPASISNLSEDNKQSHQSEEKNEKFLSRSKFSLRESPPRGSDFHSWIGKFQFQIAKILKIT